MTVALDPQTLLIACLVADKKYRKMGGDEGLKSAIKRRNAYEKDTIFVGQVIVEDLLNDSAGSINDKFFNVLRRDFAFGEEKNIILIQKYSDYFKSPRISKDQVMKLRNWLCGCPFKVLDNPEKIDVLSNRVQTGLLVRDMCKIKGFESRGLQWPEFELKGREGTRLEYPVIVKPIDACATDEAHWMTLLNSKPDSFNFSLSDGCLVQKFHEHFGVLYKVYVIGDIIEIVARPSITARDAGPILRFNTHKFKATEGELSEEKRREALERLERVRELVEEFAKELKNKLQLTWFGIDVIIPEEQSDGLMAAVIDVNYMPGYDGIKDLSDKLINAILE